jgi:hypothetical protein
MSKRIVTFGEILLRLSPPSHLRLTQATSFDLYYGCAEANVAASLAKFGLPVKFITAVPANELGESCLSMLRSFGVAPIALTQGKRIGIYYFEQGASERPGKVVYDREGSSFSILRIGMIDWETIFKDADSDVDEIWNPNFSDFIRSGKIRHEAARLEMQFHYYHLNCVGIGRANSKWTHPYFAKIDYINSNKNLSEIRTKARLPVIGNAGWHFSYLGGPNKVSEKISAFAHQETNTKTINELDHLNRCINS